MDAGAEGGVEVAQHLLAVLFGGGHRDPYGTDRLVDQLPVPVGEFIAKVVQVEAHHTEAEVERAGTLDLQHPA